MPGTVNLINAPQSIGHRPRGLAIAVVLLNGHIVRLLSEYVYTHSLVLLSIWPDKLLSSVISN